MKKDVSVVICMYNTGKYIEECLDSVSKDKNAEVIVVNDGSTDDSVEKAKKFDVHLINNTKNCGLGASRNIGLSAVKTPYTMFLDSDDYYSPGAIPKMLDAIQGHEIAVCNTRTFGDFERDYGKLKLQGSHNLTHEVSMKTPVVCWNKIYRTDTLFNTGLHFSTTIPDDNPFWFLFCCEKYGCKINYIPDTLCNYRQVINGSFSSQERCTNPYYDAIKSSFFMYDYLLAHRLEKHLDWYFDTYFFNMVDHYKGRTGKTDEEVCRYVSQEIKKRGLQSEKHSAKIAKILDMTYFNGKGR